MKKTYIPPLSRFVNLSLEENCCLFLSSFPKQEDDDSDVSVDDEGDVLTRKTDIWGNSNIWDN